MGVIKVLLICSLSVCVLLCFLSFLYPLDVLDISWLWAANLQAIFTPPLLFLLLNLVMGALFLINSGFLNSSNKAQQGQAQHNNEAHPGKKGLPQSNSARPSSIPSPSSTSSSARGLPPKQAPKNVVVRKQLTRSKSAMAPSVSTTKSNGSTDFQADQTVKKKKKKGSSSNVDGGERADSENASLKKALSAPSNGDGADDNEVDRRAEDFIGKFYLQMKMQRLESLQRYTQRMDRSHGR